MWVVRYFPDAEGGVTTKVFKEQRDARVFFAQATVTRRLTPNAFVELKPHLRGRPIESWRSATTEGK